MNWTVGSVPLSDIGGGNYPILPQSTGFTILEGEMIAIAPGQIASTVLAGRQDYLYNGGWTVSQPTPGHWELGLTTTYSYQFSTGLFPPIDQQATLTNVLHIAASADYSAANSTQVTTSPTQTTTASVLGGASAVGGVTVTLPAGAESGTLAVQQLPNADSLTYTQIVEGQMNGPFTASTGPFQDSFQAWNVSYPELSEGQTATLVFHFDPEELYRRSNLPPIDLAL